MEQEVIYKEMNMNVSKLLEEKQKEVGEMAKEIAEREFELLELNLFISSIGKKALDEATESVKRIREMEKRGDINLTEFEDLADEF